MKMVNTPQIRLSFRNAISLTEQSVQHTNTFPTYHLYSNVGTKWCKQSRGLILILQLSQCISFFACDLVGVQLWLDFGFTDYRRKILKSDLKSQYIYIKPPTPSNTCRLIQLFKLCINIPFYIPLSIDQTHLI